MANEFVAKNGLISQNDMTVSGSLTVTTGITGSLQGTSSWAESASNAVSSQTASFLPIATYGITASWAQSASNAQTSSTMLVTTTTTGVGPYYVMFTSGTTGAQATLVDSNGMLFNATTNTLTTTSSFATTASFALASAGGSGGISQGKVVAIATGYSNLF